MKARVWRSLSALSLGAFLVAGGVALAADQGNDYEQKECIQSCQDDTDLCSKMCKEHAGAAAGMCVDACKKQQKTCVKECKEPADEGN
jgi:hypothetical protein